MPTTPAHAGHTCTRTADRAHLLVCHQDVLHLALVLPEQRGKAGHELAQQRVAALGQQPAQLHKHGHDLRARVCVGVCV
jgi:hypothetical protein